jgi:uncharacterized membrane protein YkgB
MTTTLAQIIGPTLLAAAIGFLSNPKFYKKIMKDFKDHEGMTYFMGIFTMVIGLLIVINHNLWDSPSEIIISVLGWGAIVKGVTFLIAPSLLFSMSHPMLKNAAFMKVAMFVMMVVGVYLTYFGFFA